MLDESRGADRTLVSVEPAGEETVYDVTTTTGDYMAAGLVHHNCFARNTHTYLDLDAGDDFDRQVVVKLNAPEVLARELRSPRWTREHVAMGTNTDPYQRAEGRYRLMPGIIRALGALGHPVLDPHQGHAAGPRPARAASPPAADVPVGIGVSLALLDPDLHRSVEPGTPTPRGPARPRAPHRRRGAARAGCSSRRCCPGSPTPTTRSTRCSARSRRPGRPGRACSRCTCGRAPASGSTPGSPASTPHLVERYAALYRRGAYVQQAYREDLAGAGRGAAAPPRARRLAATTWAGASTAGRARRPTTPSRWPDGALPRVPGGLVQDAQPEQLSLL